MNATAGNRLIQMNGLVGAQTRKITIGFHATVALHFCRQVPVILFQCNYCTRVADNAVLSEWDVRLVSKTYRDMLASKVLISATRFISAQWSSSDTKA